MHINDYESVYPKRTYLCVSETEEIPLQETHKHTEVVLTYYTDFHQNKIPLPRLHGPT